MFAFYSHMFAFYFYIRHLPYMFALILCILPLFFYFFLIIPFLSFYHAQPLEMDH